MPVRPYPADAALVKLLQTVESSEHCDTRTLPAETGMPLEDLKDALAAATAEELVEIRDAEVSLMTLLRPRASVYLAPKGHAYLLAQNRGPIYSSPPDVSGFSAGVAAPAEGMPL